MSKFRKRPIVIDAFKWEPGVCFPAPAFDGLHSIAKIENSMIYPHPEILAIETLEGTIIARSGDWIIRGIGGEFYPCKPHIFDELYEEYEETESPPFSLREAKEIKDLIDAIEALGENRANGKTGNADAKND